MKIDTIKKVCVVGAGQMGRQIALNTAIHGYETWLTDSFADVLPKVDAWARKYLAGRVEKGKLTQEAADAALANFHLAPSLEEAAAGADLAIEAIIEKKEEKETLFRALDGFLSPNAIIATNSSFMVSSLFKDCVSDPSRLANLHYFNPALSMKLIEVVRGDHTSDETAETLAEFARRTAKIPVVIRKEIDGFIVNRVARSITFAALEIVSLGVADPQDVDTALENGLNHPMGPFRLMDLTGIDLTYYVMAEMEANGDHHPGFDLVEAKYKAGEFGRKTGKGWYDYT